MHACSGIISRGCGQVPQVNVVERHRAPPAARRPLARGHAPCPGSCLCCTLHVVSGSACSSSSPGVGAAPATDAMPRLLRLLQRLLADGEVPAAAGGDAARHNWERRLLQRGGGGKLDAGRSWARLRPALLRRAWRRLAPPLQSGPPGALWGACGCCARRCLGAALALLLRRRASGLVCLLGALRSLVCSGPFGIHAGRADVLSIGLQHHQGGRRRGSRLLRSAPGKGATRGLELVLPCPSRRVAPPEADGR